MREKLLFDFGWKFHEGDIDIPMPVTKTPLYLHAKTERAQWGPASCHYNESAPFCTESWTTVDLPHDYIIRQEPGPENNNTLGYFQYPNAWYRNRFRLEDQDRGKRITILFEGVAVHATVYVNGCLMARNFCGYTSFEVDITDVARFQEDNVIAVYVDASDHEGWWYEGAGIYRHVWLIKTEPVSVDLWGIWVNPQRTDGENWEVPVETILRNDSLDAAEAKITSCILDGEGNRVTETTQRIGVSAKNKGVMHQLLQVHKPGLWDVEHPVLYTMRTIVRWKGSQVDSVDTKFGFRTIRFDAEKGFYLNDKNIKLKGVCCHQDYGLTGKAMPDRVHRYRLKRLKEMGANAYRASHYPPAEATMDALDEIGFLVMDETRWFESTKAGLEQLEMMLKRDRNHPSVILWSVGNEEPLHAKEQGKRIMQTMTAFVKRYDSSRPVTTAISHDPMDAPAAEVSEVIGINYHLDQYDGIHAKYPHQPVIASECCAVGTTRGWYLDDDRNRGYLSAYDHATDGFSANREQTWKHIMARDWVAGGFQWAGIEHRGETVWPRLCSQSGALDLFLQPKDAYYQNISHWTNKPMIHILPHWNHPGREGEALSVWTYTNCEEVELFQDGQSLGIQKTDSCTHAEWKVEYHPGELRAEGREDGNVIVSETVRTTGSAVALKLRLEDGGLRADNEDMAILTCWCVDKDGRMVPDAAPYIYFYTNRYGRIVGTGSDVCDRVPVDCPDRKMRAGLCSVAVKVGDQSGTLRVYAQAEGLLPARLDMELKEVKRRPWVKSSYSR